MIDLLVLIFISDFIFSDDDIAESEAAQSMDDLHTYEKDR